MLEFRFGQPAQVSEETWLPYISIAADALVAAFWPAIVIIIILIFRHEVRDLIGRIKDVSGPGFGATFADKLAVSRAAAAAVDIQPPSMTPTPNDPFYQLAQEYPELAVLDAYRAIEKRLVDVYKLFPKLQPRKTPLGRVIALTSARILPAKALPLFTAIQETRNAAVHTHRPITAAEAIEYRDITRTFLNLLEDSVDNNMSAPAAPNNT